MPQSKEASRFWRVDPFVKYWSTGWIVSSVNTFLMDRYFFPLTIILQILFVFETAEDV